MMKSEGKKGGVWKVIGGLLLGAFGVLCLSLVWPWGALFSSSEMMGPRGPVAIMPKGPLIAGLGLLVFSFATIMTGIAQMIRPEYVLEDDWEVLSKPKLVEAVVQEPRPFFVCTRCRIVLKANETIGACPRCDSGVDCHRIDDDDTASMVVALLS